MSVQTSETGVSKKKRGQKARKQSQKRGRTKKQTRTKAEAKEHVVELAPREIAKRGRATLENVSTNIWIGLGVGSLLGLALFGARRLPMPQAWKSDSVTKGDS